MGEVVLAGPPQHRRYSVEQKIAIVGESYQPGVLMRDVMARYGLASSVIYTWRKQAREGRFGGGMFAPVAIVDQQSNALGLQDIERERLPQGEVERQSTEQAVQSDGAAMVVALRDGVRILVNKGVDEEALGKVLRALALVTGR